jgi:hypothetical protein
MRTTFLALSTFVALAGGASAFAGERVVIRNTRATGLSGNPDAVGEVLTRQDGVCLLSQYRSTHTRLPLPEVETRSYLCDAHGNEEHGKPWPLAAPARAFTR